MSAIRFLFFIATILAVAKSSAEADDVSLLAKAQSLSELKHLLRGSGLNVGKETGNKEETSSVNQSAKRILEAGSKRLLQLISINDDCCDDSNTPSMSPSSTPLYEEIFVASDGFDGDWFGLSCSMSGDLVVIGAEGVDEGGAGSGAAYLFNLDGTEVAKLTPGDDGEAYDYFGVSVSIDEKVVVGSFGKYVRVFSRGGIYERTIRCDDCVYFGRAVATLGNLIVAKGEQDSTEKLFIYATEDGQLMKVLEQGSDWIYDVAISEKYIVTTSYYGGKTIIYSNTTPDFPKIGEINQGGRAVAVSGDRIVIGNPWANDYDGGAYLYKTDGTLITALDRQDSTSGVEFGFSVAITDDKVIVGAEWDWDGSVYIYSAATGEFIKKVLDPDAENYDRFGYNVCASGSSFVVGAPYFDDNGSLTGAAYLFQL